MPNKIVLVQESPLEKKYSVNESISSAEIEQFLKSLPEDCELSFYDQFYPSISDPGAYISVQRKEYIVAYRLGNHGWSSDWFNQSIEFISAYIAINAINHNNSDSPFVLVIRKAVGKVFSNTSKKVL